MVIRKSQNKQEFDAFVASQDKSQFNQSWGWGDFQAANGNDVSRLLVEDEGRIVASACLITKPLLLGRKYLYCPRGPVFADDITEDQKEGIQDGLFAEIRNIAEEKKAVFLRFEPRKILGQERVSLRRTIDIQPKMTILLDLTKTDEELLSAMHQKTRYNIRLAEKKGVKVAEYGLDRFETFWRLLSQTTGRDGFRAHSQGYYRRMLESSVGEIGDRGNLALKLFVAEHDGEPLAVLLAAFYGDTVTYVHGASSDNNRQLMAPFLLQWETIKRAKSGGYIHYDFYGIDESKWPGVTRFKRGFGGSEDSWPGTFDVIFSSWFYDFYESLRRIRRMFK